MTPHRLVVITDLDGTLLDGKTYGYDASLPAIRRLKALEIPLVLCSSKTYGEVVLLWRELGLAGPFIVEDGGAIYVPAGYFPFPLPGFKSRASFKSLALGTDVRALRKILAETANGCRATVRSFGTMSAEEISALTGLTRDQARLALEREYDEPFLIEGGDGERLLRTLIGKGFTVSRGNRFFHLTGKHDKGKAVKIVLDLYRRENPQIFSVGLGNSANDLPLLNQVDRPVLVRDPAGGWDREVMEKIPLIELSQGIGPKGWAEAIEKIVAQVA
jgi:mannosyl-3-phosphoglycerate phosphatase